MATERNDRVSADEARDLLANLTTHEPWEEGAVNIYATASCPRHRPGAVMSLDNKCECLVVTGNVRDGDRAIMAAAPRLAHTVIAQAAEIAELRALLKGSIAAAMEALMPMAREALANEEDAEYPRLALERSLDEDAAEPWRVAVLFEKPVESFDVTTIELAARSHAHPLLALTGLRADLHNLMHAAQGEIAEPNHNHDTTEGDREFDHV